MHHFYPKAKINFSFDFKIVTTIYLIFIVSFAYAENFSIGGKELVIPTPQGFSRVTQEMDAVYRMSLQMYDQKNDQLAYYIPDSDIPAAMAGELPSSERIFLLKVNKKIKNMIVGSEGFAELKNRTKRQNKEIFNSVKSRISGLMKGVSEGISKEFDVDFALQISQMIPLEPHYESDNSLAYSIYIRVSVEGTKDELIVSATTTIVNVSGKVLFLYCYGPQDEIEWTRSASKSWAERVIDSNTQPPTRSSSGRGLEWETAIEKGIGGGIAGGLIALIIGIFRKRRKGYGDSAKSDIEKTITGKCPACGLEYKNIDYREDSENWFCSHCKTKIPKV